MNLAAPDKLIVSDPFLPHSAARQTAGNNLPKDKPPKPGHHDKTSRRGFLRDVLSQ
ncbi:hypothetical protein [Bradyrhizobium sp. dw_78]|uniref:hypothetical protein n=1 Tax=Bradyrhizobium sp. dw_78 TaxID=2719793 RepID=UPI001BD30740|nr:hypothetical protein [Bradyrhizobium sp. dw_78]